MKLSRPRSLIGLAAFAGVVLVAALAHRLHDRFSAGRSGLVETRATRSRLAVTVQSAGTVEPENRLEIKAPVGGRIEKVLVHEGETVKKGQVLAWMSSTERAALLDAASAKGKAELEAWNEFYKPTPITAPIDGTVIQRNVEPGQTFTTQDAILVLSNRLTVKAQVDETDVAQIKLGQQATIVLDAFPHRTIAAHVDHIAFDAKTANSITTYFVDVLPDETPDFMRSGMTADVIFLVALEEHALSIPTAAISIEDGHETVLVPGSAKEGGKPVRRVVETGLSDGRRVEIRSGLADNEPVFAPASTVSGSRQPGAAAGSPQ